MRLQELQRRVRMHLGRYHAQQIILQPDAVHRPYLVSFDYKAQAPRETPGNLLLPVESYPYRHVVQDECRLAEQGGTRDRVEGKFVVERPVVVYLSVHPTHPLGAGTVRDYLKDYLPCGHDADIDFGLFAGKPPDYKGVILLANGYFVHHLTELFLVDFLEVLFPRDYEESCHIGCTGAHGQMLFSLCVIMM